MTSQNISKLTQKKYTLRHRVVRTTLAPEVNCEALRAYERFGGYERDDLGDLEDTNKQPYKVTYTSPKSQNEFLGLLGDEIRTKTMEEIKSADAFTIMADRTPDVSHKDQMSVC